MTRVARLKELTDGGLARVEIDGAVVALARVGDAVYALGEACAHRPHVSGADRGGRGLGGELSR